VTTTVLACEWALVFVFDSVDNPFTFVHIILQKFIIVITIVRIRIIRIIIILFAKVKTLVHAE